MLSKYRLKNSFCVCKFTGGSGLVFIYRTVNGLVFYMMPTEVIFGVDVCTAGSSASAPWSQGGGFHQVTPDTARGVDERRSTPEAGHELN